MPAAFMLMHENVVVICVRSVVQETNRSEVGQAFRLSNQKRFQTLLIFQDSAKSRSQSLSAVPSTASAQWGT